MAGTRYHGKPDLRKISAGPGRCAVGPSAGGSGQRAPSRPWRLAGAVAVVAVLALGCAGPRRPAPATPVPAPVVRRVPWLGVEVQEVTPILARTLGLDPPRGCVVTRVLAGTPAERAGLRWGDVILSVNGVPVGGAEDLAEWSGVLGGGTAVVGILRGGAAGEVTVSLPRARSPRPPEEPPKEPPPQGGAARKPAPPAEPPPEPEPVRPAVEQSAEERAFRLYQEGKLEEARAVYQEAVRNNPSDPAVLNNLGGVLNLLGRPRDAERVLARALSLDPGFAEARFNLGSALWAQGKREEALEAYRRTVRADPTMVQAWEALAVSAWEMGRVAEAEEAASAGLARSPGNRRLALVLGRALSAQERFVEAARVLSEALRLHPEDPDLLLELGMALDEGGRPSEAVKVLDRLVAQHPSAAAFHNRALARLHAGDPQGAVEDEDQALRMEPQFPAALRTRARALWRLGAYQEALGAWDRALRLDPGWPAVLADLEEAAAFLAGSPAGVRRIQEWLRRAGEEPGPVDGVLGERTRRALRRLQRERGLVPTGEVNGPTLLELVRSAGRPSGEGG
ncbi:tetratricopeptide repeat protein [Deferrisoma camini]|uniref:tetratricopeptide repeat protein n=1 Tax=Deferrisoma camini TaxID=1035120 RepID=UPI00046C8E78|nr:tetratricopeptide repeat protein [Deferrisoma camini]